MSMNMNQLAIDFGTPARPADTLPRARKRDPATSHAAAAAAASLSGEHQAAILAALARFGALGKDGIAARTRLSGVQVCRRLPELERAGLVAPTGRTVPSDSGRAEREFRIAP